MSAIFGIIDFEGRPLKEEWIKSMQADLAHRGPDGQGLYREPSVALGHMLLQVTPESIYDKSPYEEDGLVITANARLDEREAIMDRIGTPPSERDKITDPLLLLRSFKKFGKDFVKDIYGDFAFAIWDKNKRELFCARDHIGVKPFLYYFQDNRFIFSTEIRSIIKLPFITTFIDIKYLIDRSVCYRDRLSDTTWKNVIRLNAASSLLANKNNILNTKFWRPKYKRNNKLKSMLRCTKELLITFDKVLNDHTRCIGNIGVPLSGGLDSSSIACLVAKKFANNEKQVYSVSSVLNYESNPSNETDEIEYINEVINKEKNIKPSFVFHSNLKFEENLDHLFERHYSTFNLFFYVDEAIAEKFRSLSVKRVLSGHMGDMTTSNRTINPLIHLLLSAKFRTFYCLFKKLKGNSKYSFFQFIKINIVSPLLPHYIRRSFYQYKKIVTSLVENDLPLLLSSEEKTKLVRAIIEEKKADILSRFKISSQLWDTDVDYFLEEEDTGTSYYQVEYSYPLVDRRIIEFLLQVPVEHFNACGYSRGLIRKTMEGILPEKVRNRENKGNYSPGFHQILKNYLMSLKSFPDESSLVEELNNIIDILDIKKINSFINLIINTEKYDKFDKLYLTFFQTILWIKFIEHFKNRIL